MIKNTANYFARQMNAEGASYHLDKQRQPGTDIVDANMREATKGKQSVS
ncbi:hypothetical protein PC116_g12809 [Phytophthora cactorum]|uniref:Uncharacterized protein n=1 Tax=Phytophthora cactorum TaxID=29920 RepID=A0A8T1KQZ4_9STRA|nr:hypothetical protein Pcac1_g6961 [Phytophthora cactorum]KAG2880543.1 hypothetical protein PC114_g22026 [Phytophthora cactorum]KAG2927787.1 hypothetical protein PC117_g14509 [Phytophthora cactorum]KAG3006921.1 hypothetical protein PC119_g14791 [Phytophthora cactorum]KAG3154082.1 hypothetical protein C6341_g15745 [Phytophthora cactorum]